VSSKQGERKSLPKGHYLLGHIKLSTGEFEAGMEHLRTAKALYDQSGNEAGSFQATLGLAKGALGLKDFENAAYYLNLADQLQGDSNLGHFYHLKSQLAFFQHDYETGLEFSLEGIEAYQANNSQLCRAYSDAGFFSALLGKVAEADKFTFQAEEIAFKQNDESAYFHNMINKVMINQCRSISNDQLVISIENWAKTNQNTGLKDLLNFSVKWQCPLWTVGDGSPDPPPDPPENQESRSNGGKN